MDNLRFSIKPTLGFSVKTLLQEGQTLLARASITSSASESRILLEFVTGYSLEYLLSHGSNAVSLKCAKKFFGLIARRCRHEPIAYITGKKEFYGAEFKVNKHVLIPRPDTETLVELCIQCVPASVSQMSILDLGTGSGCLLLTLLKLFPKSFGLGVDIQAGALAVARQNASKFALKERVNFSKKDWKNMRLQAEFDLIVCNPPYIRTCDIPDLALDVKEYEPDCALDGGYDGLRCYSTLMPMIRKLLKPEGVSVLECGYGQLADIRAIAHKNGLSLTKYMKDYSGNTRAIALRKVCR